MTVNEKTIHQRPHCVDVSNKRSPYDHQRLEKSIQYNKLQRTSSNDEM